MLMKVPFWCCRALFLMLISHINERVMLPSVSLNVYVSTPKQVHERVVIELTHLCAFEQMVEDNFATKLLTVYLRVQ